MRGIVFRGRQGFAGHLALMQYDPFAAHNLLRIVSLTGLIVMMTEALPGPACLAIGLVCLLWSGILSLFPRPSAAVPKKRRPSAIQSARSPQAETPSRPYQQPWQPPGRGSPKPAAEPHPALLATVAGRTPAGSPRRRY